MKVGDLVTLSEYGLNLEACWRHRKAARAGKVVGLLKEVYVREHTWDKSTYYIVDWIGSKYKGLRRMAWAKPGMFKRKDLKMYRVPKK